MSSVIAQPVSSTVPASHSVTYSCKFTNTWSSETHPVNYPNNAHWSPPVIAAHGNKYTMWKPGNRASKGVKIVAETGSTGTLKKKIGVAMEKNKAGDVITGKLQFNSDTQEQTLPDIALTPWFDMMSSITMVAPSPDWYTGFYNVNPVGPIDQNSITWYKSFDIVTYPWDAGTDEGDDYVSSNQKQKPRVPILQLTEDTVPEDGVLLNPEKMEVLPMARWSCTLKDSSSCVDYDKVIMERKANRDCTWAGAGENENKRKKRCQKKYRGRSVSDWCPKACNVCEA